MKNIRNIKTVFSLTFCRVVGKFKSWKGSTVFCRTYCSKSWISVLCIQSETEITETELLSFPNKNTSRNSSSSNNINNNSNNNINYSSSNNNNSNKDQNGCNVSTR